MNNYVTVVRYDPLTLWKSVNYEWLDLMILPKPFLQLIGNRLEVRLAGTRADQEKIGERGNAAQVDGDEAFCLFVGNYFGTKLGEAFGVDSGNRFKNLDGRESACRSGLALIPVPSNGSSPRVQHVCELLWQRYPPGESIGGSLG